MINVVVPKGQRVGDEDEDKDEDEDEDEEGEGGGEEEGEEEKAGNRAFKDNITGGSFEKREEEGGRTTHQTKIFVPSVPQTSNPVAPFTPPSPSTRKEGSSFSWSLLLLLLLSVVA